MSASEREVSAEHTDAIKETAEYFRYGLILGLHSVADTLAWIDTVLISEPAPDIALIEASLSGSRGVNTVVEWLGQMPGECDRQAVARHLMITMLKRLNQAPELAPRIARWLYEMALEDYAPDEAENQMLYFDDAFGLAIDGVYGDVKEIRKKMAAFLASVTMR